MAKKFIKAIGLHNVFNVVDSALDITSIKETLQYKVNQNSIIFITAQDDSSYGYPDGTKYIWTHNELYCSNTYSVVDETASSETSFTIQPNKMYMFGEKTDLTIALSPALPGVVNEYTFQFTSGTTQTSLVVPSTVVWLKDPDIKTNKKYVVSIENNLGIIGEWSNE